MTRAVRSSKAFARERPVERGGLRRYLLAELLSLVTDANRHGEVPSGQPRGRERW